jgi:chemotaxis protein methyltransferase CheR
MSAAPELKYKRALVIEDEKPLLDSLGRELERLGFQVEKVDGLGGARESLSRTTFDFVLCDIHLPDGNGMELLKQQPQFSVVGSHRQTAWAFITGDVSPELLEKAVRLGASDLLRKPFSRHDLVNLVHRVESGKSDVTREIMRIMEGITGIELRDDKRLLVETRLNHRARSLGFASDQEYLDYFREHRNEEIPQLISVVSTHTTEFFRHPEQFEVLTHRILPELERLRKGAQIRIWSAACSTGEEPYSIAAVAARYFWTRGRDPERELPRLVDILGTDIDFRSLDQARNGVYTAGEISKVAPELLRFTFDAGHGELAGQYRIKDPLHQLCRFEQLNLLSPVYRHKGFHIVFIRNVLMYFRRSLAEEILEKVIRSMAPGGYLFLAESEDSLGLKKGLRPVARSVYQVADR